MESVQKEALHHNASHELQRQGLQRPKMDVDNPDWAENKSWESFSNYKKKELSSQEEFLIWIWPTI